MILAVLSMVLAVDPCAAVEYRAVDPGLARVYAAVAEDEDRRGARDSACAAWRLAAQLQNPGGPAERALQQHCAERRQHQSFEQGQALFNSDDCAAALPLLRAARGGTDDRAAALFEGICAWELADDPGALSALTVARGDAQLAPTAELFLGLLAVRSADTRSALARMRAAGEDTPALRSTAAQLLRWADRRDRLVFEASTEGGYDSNALSAAFSSVVPGGADDAFVAVTGSVAFRPLADHGPFLVVAGGYRKQARYSQSDVGLATGTLGWDFAVARLRASVDYGLDFVALGGVPWLLRQRGTVSAMLPVGSVLMSAEYVLRHELLWEPSVADDSGFRHAGRLAAALRFDAHLFELSALLTRAQARTAERSALEAGGELRWNVQPFPRLSFEAAVGARWRGFDAVDPDLKVLRREVQLDARAGVDFALHPNVGLFVTLEARRVASSVSALTFTRLEASAGVRFSLGVW